MKPSRKHHYIPRFYLTGFTQNNDPKDKLWVIDQQDIKQFKAAPSKIAFETDFYRVDLPDVELDAFEQGLAYFESKAADVIKRILSLNKIQDSNDFNILINFIALIIARVPERRERTNSWAKDLSKMTLNMICATEETYIHHMKKANIDVSHADFVPYEQMKNFLKKDKYTVEFDRHTHLKNMIITTDTLIPLLAQRNWALIRNTNSNHPFICSDNPACLTWTRPDSGFYSPGFGLRNTEITLPLTKELFLIGRFEPLIPYTTVNKVKQIAALNSRTGMHATRFVYSMKQNFPWLTNNDTIAGVKDLFRYLKKEKGDQR